MKEQLQIISGKEIAEENISYERTADFADHLELNRVAQQNYYLLSYPIADIRKHDMDLSSFLKGNLPEMPPLYGSAPPILLGIISRGGPEMSGVVNGFSRIAGAINSHHTHINAYVPVTGTAFTDNLEERIDKGEIRLTEGSVQSKIQTQKHRHNTQHDENRSREEEQIAQLIIFLESMKFSGPELEAKVREQINLGRAEFNIPFFKKYGEDPVVYHLHFVEDQQFNAYRFESYRILYSTTPRIPQAMINGVETTVLEQSFSMIDWEKYFKEPERITKAEQEDVATAMLDFWKLNQPPTNLAESIHNKLIGKYWPEEKWSDDIADMMGRLTVDQTYTTADTGRNINADLAYYSASRKLDHLYEKISDAGFEYFTERDVYVMLEEKVSQSPESFELRFQWNQPEGYAEYIIPVTLVDGNFQADNYLLSLTPYPAIRHGELNGVDTQKLEALMSIIDWAEDASMFTVNDNEEPEFPPDVNNVLVQITELKNDNAGTQIADLLTLKYWVGLSFYEDLIERSAWDLLTGLPKREQSFPMEINPRATFNLLNGRPAAIASGSTPRDEELEFVRLQINKPRLGDNYKIKVISGLTMLDLELQLSMLAIIHPSFHTARGLLMQGDMVTVERENGDKLKVEINPEEKTLNLYTLNRQLIPANLRLAPDWQYQQPAPAIKKEQSNRHTAPQKKFGHKRKGRRP